MVGVRGERGAAGGDSEGCEASGTFPPIKGLEPSCPNVPFLLLHPLLLDTFRLLRLSLLGGATKALIFSNGLSGSVSLRNGLSANSSRELVGPRRLGLIDGPKLQLSDCGSYMDDFRTGDMGNWCGATDGGKGGVGGNGPCGGTNGAVGAM